MSKLDSLTIDSHVTAWQLPLVPPIVIANNDDLKAVSTSSSIALDQFSSTINLLGHCKDDLIISLVSLSVGSLT